MFVSLIKSIILGIVEGATEFLPISSTGHLILVNQWVSFSQPFTVMLDIVIQLGAILAVVVYFWNRLWPFNKDQIQAKTTWGIWLKTIVGVLPAIIIGAILGRIIEEKLFNPWVVTGALMLGGIILILMERKSNSFRFSSVSEMPLMTAFSIGLIQCSSMIPGTSRAAATIIGAMILGVSRQAAVEFSFFLAIPTMIAATSYSLFKHGLLMSGSELIILTTGFLAAFFTALAAVKFLINYIQRHNFKSFGYYRIALSVLVILFFWLK